MGFSKEWEKEYASNHHMSIWPWSDLVSYVMRYTDIRKRKLRVLEIGCGAGANIPLFDSLNADYYAIEGSPTIVEELHKRYPQYKDTIVTGDFTERIDFAGQFDLVVDRAALTHNPEKNINKCLRLIWNKLNDNGKFIGIDWFSTKYSLYLQGEQGEDVYTRTNYKDGSFAQVGNVHFSDKEHLINLFNQFKIEVLEEKLVHAELPEEKLFASWNFIAKKTMGKSDE